MFSAGFFSLVIPDNWYTGPMQVHNDHSQLLSPWKLPTVISFDMIPGGYLCLEHYARCGWKPTHTLNNWNCNDGMLRYYFYYTGKYHDLNVALMWLILSLIVRFQIILKMKVNDTNQGQCVLLSSALTARAGKPNLTWQYGKWYIMLKLCISRCRIWNFGS